MRQPTAADRARQAQALSDGFAADVARQRAATAALVGDLAGSVVPARAGAHDRLTLEQIAAAGRLSPHGHRAPVVKIGGRGFG